MKKSLYAGLFLANSLMAMYGEQAYLYKDNRVMGAGGANIAVGGYTTSVFYNPAGLKQIKKEHGYVVDLLGLQLGGSEKFKDFADDLDNALTDDNLAELIGVLNKYDGEHFHANVTNYTAIAKNNESLAWSVGLLIGADLNYMTHSAGSANGASLETTSRGYGGVIVSFAKDFDTKFGKFDVGISGKYVQQKSYEGLIPISDLIQTDDIIELMQDKYEKDSSGFGVDLGVNYHPFANSSLHPVVGLSILNIGGMSMDDNYGRQPMTVNVGVAISPEVPVIDRLIIAADYVDVFNANQVRVYTYNPNVNEAYSYIEADDTDFMKKVRAGVTAGLVDTQYFSMDLGVGWYQEAYTAGLNMELTLLKLSLATYEESLGYGDVEIKDRRYSLQLGIGW